MDNSLFRNLFDNFLKRPGIDKEIILHACSKLNLNPPLDFLTMFQFTNGGEGFIQHSYFRLYSVDELLFLNQAYEIKKFAPGLVIFGSNGGGDAFGFDMRKDLIEIIQIPFIPMDFQYAKPLGGSFTEFLYTLVESHDEEDFLSPQINMSTVGKEVHEKAPIVFGGHPMDEENKVLIPSPSDAHAKICVFWNEVYIGAKDKKKGVSDK